MLASLCLREKIVHQKLGVEIRHLSDSQGPAVVSVPEKTKHTQQLCGENNIDKDDDHFSVMTGSEVNMKKDYEEFDNVPQLESDAG